MVVFCHASTPQRPKPRQRLCGTPVVRIDRIARAVTTSPGGTWTSTRRTSGVRPQGHAREGGEHRRPVPHPLRSSLGSTHASDRRVCPGYQGLPGICHPGRVSFLRERRYTPSGIPAMIARGVLTSPASRPATPRSPGTGYEGHESRRQ